MKGPGHLRQVMPSPSGVSLEMQGDVGGITAGRDNKKTPAILDVVSMKPMDMFLWRRCQRDIPTPTEWLLHINYDQTLSPVLWQHEIENWT